MMEAGLSGEVRITERRLGYSMEPYSEDYYLGNNGSLGLDWVTWGGDEEVTLG